MTPPSVSIVVAVLDEARTIGRAAAGATGQRYEGDLEVLFLDGGSRDGTRQHLEALAAADPRLRVLDNPSRTQVAALNAGLREARGDVVVQMDAHAFYPPTYVAEGVARLGRGDVGWVTGPPVPVGVDAGSRRVATALGSRLATGGADKWRPRPDGEETELDTGVFGGIWWKATLHELGGWDERWVANHDAELAARHLAAGGRIVCLPHLAVEYVPRNALRELWRQYRGYGFYRAGTGRRHPETVRPSHVLSLLPALATVGAVGPGPVGRLARRGLTLYGAIVAVEGARLPRSGAQDLVLLPAVLATIHLSWGFGFLAGCREFGVPWAGLGSVTRRLAQRLRRGAGPRPRP